MSLTLKSNPTISFTGGTDVVFTESTRVNNVVNYLVAADPMTARRTLKSSVVEPKGQPTAPGGFTQAKNTVTLLVPKVLANGNTTFNKIELLLSVDRETSDAERVSLIDMILQAAGPSGAFRNALMDSVQP